ncbi:FKBP-type peptidyl-prolyl cis-trans isomerase, partial [Pseudomonas sp. Sample_9]
FDSSWSRGKPFQCVIGTGRVIKGWDQGLLGMQVGGKRKLLVPAHLGYGERTMGKIPPNSNLVFEIELLEVLTRED